MREMGADFSSVEVDAHADVVALKRAVIAELRLGVPADTVTLTVVGAPEALDSTLTVEESIGEGVLKPRAKLIAKIHPPVGAAAAGA